MTAQPRYGAIIECWCCGRTKQQRARGLCIRCYNRWHRRGFAPPGPGPEFRPAAERAQEYAQVITTFSAAEAGRVLGISARTVVRWRSALRQAPC